MITGAKFVTLASSCDGVRLRDRERFEFISGIVNTVTSMVSKLCIQIWRQAVSHVKVYEVRNVSRVKGGQRRSEESRAVRGNGIRSPVDRSRLGTSPESL